MSARRHTPARTARRAVLAIALGGLALASVALRDGSGLAQEPAPVERVRFEAVDVFVDSGERPLAAYQFRLVDRSGRARIVGVEGGEHAAFRDAPRHDPRALMGGTIIVAAFDTGEDLPVGRTRVARLHFEVRGERADGPDYHVELEAAAASDETKIPEARIEIEEGGRR